MTEPLVKCGDCAEFIKPEHPVYNRVSAGKCRSYEEGMKTPRSPKEIKAAQMARGNCPFLYCTLRKCIKFIPVNGESNG